jgi:hypothetical protein
MEDVLGLDLVLQAEKPNANLYRFKGTVRVAGDEYADMALIPGSEQRMWAPDADKPGECAHLRACAPNGAACAKPV